MERFLVNNQDHHENVKGNPKDVSPSTTDVFVCQTYRN